MNGFFLAPLLTAIGASVLVVALLAGWFQPASSQRPALRCPDGMAIFYDVQHSAFCAVAPLRGPAP